MTGQALPLDLVSRDIGFIAAMAAYIDAGRPHACPCCGSWGGPQLPMCTDAGWTHGESCVRTQYAEDVCERCFAALVAAL